MKYLFAASHTGTSASAAYQAEGFSCCANIAAVMGTVLLAVSIIILSVRLIPCLLLGLILLGLILVVHTPAIRYRRSKCAEK